MLKYIGLFMAKGLLGAVAIALHQMANDSYYKDLRGLNGTLCLCFTALALWVTYLQVT